MKGTINYYQQRKFHVFVTKTFPDLVQLKKEGNKETFNKLILKILPSIKKYINGRLSTAINAGHFSKNEYNADEFVDQLLLKFTIILKRLKKQRIFTYGY
jgi:hypothetical protein